MYNEHRLSRTLEQYIKNTVKEIYNDYGYRGKVGANVEFQKRITITINTEEPFMGEKFWGFLGTVGEKLEFTLKLTGYTYKKTSYYYNFCILEYAFTSY